MSSSALNVCIIGIGSMGYGMGLALLESSSTKTVTGYDLNKESVTSFHEKCVEKKKAMKNNRPPQSIQEAIGVVQDDDVVAADVVILSLVNENQCENVCFSSSSCSLVNLLKPKSCVIVCSTVTASWCRSAAKRFKEHDIRFMDCPVSGGPARAAQGDLTMMASKCDDSIMKDALPLIQALGREVHIIDGGVGMGSTAKMVHQLLAGVHICAAAEALALASKAGIDTNQMYDIVNGAAGASWMFQDRGKRMIEETNSSEVKSALNIFVKDLNIVHEEAKAVQSPIPLASAALQQFISGQSLGLGLKDDSQVLKVYQCLNGTFDAVNAKGTSKETE